MFSPHTEKVLQKAESDRKKKSAVIIRTNFKHRGSLVCTLCSGKNCRVEDWTRCAQPFIKGLHSNLVANRQIASARLSNPKIQQFDIIKQLKDANVRAVFNLEEPGEHARCGDGIVND